MKTKILKFSLLTAALGIGLWSCKKEEVTSTNPNNFAEPLALMASDYEIIGAKHNEGLEYVYDKLVEYKSSTNAPISKETTFSLSANYVKEFMNDYNMLEDERTLTNNIINTNLVENPIVINTQSKLYSNESDLSDELKQKLDDLNIIISNSSLELNTIIQNIKNMENVSQTELTNEELHILYSATSVAKHSLTYWHDNMNKWKDLFDNNIESWYGNIGKADIAGAVAGAVYAVGANVIVGAGTVAYGGAIIGGAVTGSVFQGVYDLLSNWW